MTSRVAVVGGGIAGLAAAWEAVDEGHEVELYEAGPRFGGLIATSPVVLPDGTQMVIDEAADAFLARVPDAVALCEELGLGDQLVEPAVGRAMVSTPGGLKWFPTDSVLGVPTDPDALASVGLLSDEGMQRVRAEASLRVEPLDEDTSVGALLRSRFGDELVERVVGPLVGGISAGDVDRMSVRATTPQLAEAASNDRPMSENLAVALARAPSGPVFNGLRGGTATLIDALVSALRSRGVGLSSDHPVRSIEQELSGFDRIVVATPARHAAQLVEGVSPGTADLLRGIDTASVALSTLVYRRDSFDWPLDASGYLVPRDAGLFLTAVSWGSTKWPRWGDSEYVVVRASVGHRDDDRAAHLDQSALVDQLRSDLEATCGLAATPVATRVSRWVDGFHQYDVGHLELVDRIEQGLRSDTEGRVVVAGCAYRGVGIPACIRSGRAAVS